MTTIITNGRPKPRQATEGTMLLKPAKRTTATTTTTTAMTDSQPDAE